MKPNLSPIRFVIAAAAALAGPALADTVLIDFDQRADGSPITLANNTSLADDDVRAVFAGFGIDINVLSHPARLLISNRVPPGVRTAGEPGLGVSEGNAIGLPLQLFALPFDGTAAIEEQEHING